MARNQKPPIFSFVILGDTHITDVAGTSSDAGTSAAIHDKFSALIDKIAALCPAFVIHLGDVTHPGPRSDDYPGAAREFHARAKRTGVPWYLLPGNHDIGEKLHRALPMIDDKLSITKANIARYEAHFGPQYQSFTHKGCAFVLLNSLLLNSGLADEEAQWGWLERTLEKYARMRLFICSHYPLFLSREDEADHYDNMAEPARSRLADLIRKHRVEGVYTGHVHNWFYNRIGTTHHFTLPSTSINRHDYLEFFRTPPGSRAIGRYGPAKTGFFWIDVHETGHVPHLLRQSAPETCRTHSWRPRGPLPTVDLRMPWCEYQEVSSPWGAEIFERKRVRNDYPVAALWEMGVRDLRIPVCDLLDKESARRVADLAALGHRFIVVQFGLPDAERQHAISMQRDVISRLEIVALQNTMEENAKAFACLREMLNVPVYLNPTHAEVHGYTSAHGLRTENTKDRAWLARATKLCRAVDGFVFQVPLTVHPFDAFRAAREVSSTVHTDAALHLCNVSMCLSDAPDGTVDKQHELNRVAEAVMLARAQHEISVLLDNFVELDRGYFHCFGLYDRLYNPNPGGCLVTRLDCLLPPKLSGLTNYKAKAARILTGKANGNLHMLILPDTALSASAAAMLPPEMEDLPLDAVDLVSGAGSTGTLRTFFASVPQDARNPILARTTPAPLH